MEDNNIIPDINFGFILSSDEETGSRYGLNYIVNNYPDIFKKEDYILVPDAGSSDGLNIEIAEKGILWLKFNIVGKQAHASNPGLGLNSTRLGSILLLELDKVLHQKYNNVNKIFNPDISTFEPTKVEKI